jgi:hypothetical protein
MTGIEQPYYIGTTEFTTNPGVDIQAFTAAQIVGTDDVKFNWVIAPQTGINISKIEIKEGATVVATPVIGTSTTTITGVAKGEHLYSIEVSYTGSRTGTVVFSAAPITVLSSGDITLGIKDVTQSTATLTITPAKLSHVDAITEVSVVVTPKGGVSLPTINLNKTQLDSLNSGVAVDVSLTGLENATKYDVSVNVVGLDNITGPITISFTAAGPVFSMQPIAKQLANTADVVLTWAINPNNTTITGLEIYDGATKITSSPLSPATTTYTVEDVAPGEHTYTVKIL